MVGVLGEDVSVLVKVEEWVVESDVFKMGTWREIGESLKGGGQV